MPEKTPSPAAAPAPVGDPIGEVVGFFATPSAAIIQVKKGTLGVGDTIWIRGHTTDLKQAIASMQIERKPIQQAKVGQEVGVQVSARVRRGDQVYKIS